MVSKCNNPNTSGVRGEWRVGGGGGGVTSYIWHITDVRAD